MGLRRRHRYRPVVVDLGGLELTLDCPRCSYPLDLWVVEVRAGTYVRCPCCRTLALAGRDRWRHGVLGRGPCIAAARKRQQAWQGPADYVRATRRDRTGLTWFPAISSSATDRPVHLAASALRFLGRGCRRVDPVDV